MKSAKKILAIILTVATLLAVIPFTSVSAGEYQLYYQHMLNIGFPAAYAEKLTNLHMIHPDWIFEASNITQLSRDYSRPGPYTWDYVISREMSPEDRNLVSTYSGSAYIKNWTSYDSGWYPANTAAVKYAMDPRNFLDERHIFMFLDLYKGSTPYTVADVETALNGTFMANKVIPDAGNTKTYAQYFIELGNTYNINPVFIAARLKQEQGTDGTSPLISGSCGTTLYNSYVNGTNGAPSSGYGSSLKNYNGYYNYFNIGAAGDGYFAIWLGGMKEAQKGVAETGPWTTRMKAIEGGVVKLRDTYLASYRHTLYYQKFNVDARSVIDGECVNFSYQYMQNLMAPYSESRTMQTALSSNLDIKFKFIIPVYEGMPSSTSDPGTYFQKDKFSYASAIDVPASASESGKIAEISLTVNSDNTPVLNLAGWGLSTLKTTEYSYSVDYGTNWTKLSASFRQDVANTMSNYPSHSVNAYSGSIDVSKMSPGNHIVIIKGKTGPLSSNGIGQNFPIALINLKIESELSAVIKSFDSPSSSEVLNIVHGETFLTHGWALAPSGLNGFTLTFDGQEPIILAKSERPDVIETQPEDLVNACMDCHAFADTVNTSNLTIGTHTGTVQGHTKSGKTFVVGTFKINVTLADSYDIPLHDFSTYSYEEYKGKNYLFDVSPNTTVADILANINAPSVIFDHNGYQVDPSKTAGSGYIVKRNVGGILVTVGTIIVTGDYNGDGEVNGVDVIRVKKQLLGQSTSGYEAAGDFDRNGTITQDDLKNITSSIGN